MFREHVPVSLLTSPAVDAIQPYREEDEYHSTKKTFAWNQDASKMTGCIGGLNIEKKKGLADVTNVYGQQVNTMKQRPVSKLRQDFNNKTSEHLKCQQSDRNALKVISNTASQPSLVSLGKKPVLEDFDLTKPLACVILPDESLMKDDVANKSSMMVVDQEMKRYDPLLAEEYVHDIFDHLKVLEQKYRPNPSYMKKQREMTPELRAVLIDWLIEVSEDCRFVGETLFLMVNYVDRFMSKKNVSKHQLQLVGLSAIFIASKYEEIDAVTVTDLIQLSDNSFNAEHILLMEKQLLKTLEFGLNVATVRYFATRYIEDACGVLANENEMIQFPSLVYYLTELSLMHFPMLKFSASKTAAASVILALLAFGRPYWQHEFRNKLSCELSELQMPIIELHQAWNVIPYMKQNVVYKKYSRNCYNCVAAIQPPNLPPFISSSHEEFSIML